MDNDKFTRIVKNRLKICEEVLTQKGKEYSSDVDRLHNFKVAGRIDDVTPEEALWGMYRKHLVSVMDLVNDPEKATKMMIVEKITDSINYHILLEALLMERILKEKPAEGTKSPLMYTAKVNPTE